MDIAIDEYLYWYEADVVSVYDGDTITARVDLGFNVTIELRFRLSRIDAWEVRGTERPLGLLARDRARELIDGKRVVINTMKDRTGKYGRYLADVYFLNEDGEPGFTCLNDLLVQEGHAEYYEY